MTKSSKQKPKRESWVVRAEAIELAREIFTGSSDLHAVRVTPSSFLYNRICNFCCKLVQTGNAVPIFFEEEIGAIHRKCLARGLDAVDIDPLEAPNYDKIANVMLDILSDG